MHQRYTAFIHTKNRHESVLTFQRVHYRAERDLPQGGDAPAAGHSGKVQVREVSMQCSFEACVLSMILKLLNSYGCSYFTHACLLFPSGTPECRPSPRSLFTRLSREEEDFLPIPKYPIAKAEQIHSSIRTPFVPSPQDRQTDFLSH